AMCVLRVTRAAVSPALPLHDALPISGGGGDQQWRNPGAGAALGGPAVAAEAEPEPGPRPPGARLGIQDIITGRGVRPKALVVLRSEEHTSELQSLAYLVCRLLLEKKK